MIKYKKRSPKQKELLNLFNDLLDVISTDKTLMSSKDEKEKEDENENKKENKNENEDDGETMSQNEKNIRIKNINDNLD